MSWSAYPTWLNPGDNAWQMTAATLVGLMSIPALAVLYGGIVQRNRMAWGLGLLHGLQMGTDAATVWGAAVNYTCIAVVSLAVFARLGMLARSTVATS